MDYEIVARALYTISPGPVLIKPASSSHDNHTIFLHNSDLDLDRRTSLDGYLMMGLSKKASSRFAPSPPLSPIAPESDYKQRSHRRESRESLPSYASDTSIPTSTPSASSSFAVDCNTKEGIKGKRPGGLLRALDIIKRAGMLAEGYCCLHVLKLDPAQFNKLVQRIPRNLRYDYNPDRGVMVLRLNISKVHEIFQYSLMEEITSQLKNIARQNKNISDVVEKVHNDGHAPVLLAADRSTEAESTKSPDGQFCFNHRKPQCIVEIGYSQEVKKLAGLAKEYYVDSDGAIKTVLTVRVPYFNPAQRQAIATSGAGSFNLEAAFSLYRGPHRIHNDVRFRDSRGQPIHSCSIRLLLTDFLPNTLLEGEGLDKERLRQLQQCSINISASHLCQYLAEAESAQAEWDAERRLSSQQASQKRKSVTWDSDEEGGQSGEGDQASEDSASEREVGRRQSGRSRSKRRRTTHDTPFHGHGQASALPERHQKTRSMSRGRGRGEGEGEGKTNRDVESQMPQTPQTRRQTRSMSRGDRPQPEIPR